MAQFRGMDGTATIAGGTIAQIVEWSTDVDIEVMRGETMGDKWGKPKGGMGKWTGRIKCLLDYVTGQKTLIDYLANATPQSTSAALVLQMATGKTISGNALCSHFGVGQPLNGMVEVEFAFEGDGQPAIAWA